MSSKISVSTLFNYDQVNCSEDSEICLDIILTAPEKEGQKRIPVNITLALDVSGSMEGSKLESVKKTACILIDNLTENDSIGALAFSDSVWDVFTSMPMTQTNKEIAKRSISTLRSLSSTNLSQALIMASERAVSSDKNIVSRIILLSDGLPSSGICDKAQLIEMCGKMNPTISLSTFGYGYDFDAELMASLSNAGRGNYFYIQKDEDCRSAFALELGGLLSLFAQDIKITVTPTENIKLKEFLSSYEFEESPGYRGLVHGNLSYILNDIYVGEKKHSLLKLSVPEATEAVCARQTRVCDITVDYLDINTKERVKVEASAKVQYVKAGKAQKTANEDVQKQLLLIQASKLQKEAKQKADAGDLNGAKVVYQMGLAMAESNQWWDGAKDVKADFNCMLQACSDDFTYKSTGTKLAGGLLRAYTKGRVSTGNSVGTSYAYNSSAQQDMLKVFNEDEENKA